VLLVGAGRQAREHLHAIVAEWPVSWVGVVARRRERADRFAQEVRSAYPQLSVDAVDAAAIDTVLGSCHIVVCSTTATEPLFDGASLGPGACVVALGAHTASTRELSSALVARSCVVVEDRATAMRESGDVVIPIGEGLMSRADLRADLGELVRGDVTPDLDRPRVFTSVGMAWEDAVVSAAVLENVRAVDVEKEKDLS
jgi:ornithine cyclodeaminase